MKTKYKSKQLLPRWPVCFALVILTFLSFEVSGQSKNFCQTASNDRDFFESFTTQRLAPPSDNLIIRIFVHIIRQSDGSGGQSEHDVDTALDRLVADFEPHGICVSLTGIDEIWDDNLYDTQIFDDRDNDGKFDQLEQYIHPEAIDIYLFADSRLHYGAASGIPGTALVVGGTMDGISLVNSRVLSHELGHCLGLYHTSHGLCERGCAELVNGTNGKTCGDFVEDTPADPQVWQIDQNDCVWNGFTCGVANVDANGDTYNPDPSLIMAFTSPACMEYYSKGQGERMRSAIVNSTLLQSVLVPDSLTLDNLTIPEGETRLYDVKNTINASNLTTENNSSLTLRAGDYIVILPETHIKASCYFHAYIDEHCSTIDQDNFARISQSSKHNYKSYLEENEKPGPEDLAFDFKIYPNPFSDNAIIEYTLPEDGLTNVIIYDIMGKKVAVLVDNEEKVVGKYTLTLDGSQLGAGTYYCRLSTGKRIQTKKILLIK